MEAVSSSDNRRTDVNKQRPRKNNKTFTCSLHFVTIVSIPINIRDWMSFVCVHVRMCKYLSIAPQGWRTAAMSDEESPRPGDRILLFKQENMSLLLQGQKTFDARKVNYRPGRYLLGCNGRIYGVARFQRAFAVQTQRAWERLRPQNIHVSSVGHEEVERAACLSTSTWCSECCRVPPLNRLRVRCRCSRD